MKTTKLIARLNKVLLIMAAAMIIFPVSASAQGTVKVKKRQQQELSDKEYLCGLVGCR
ncbi:MAG: hypothetical protein ABFC28_08605 [Rikenellaceae bacterium]